MIFARDIASRSLRPDVIKILSTISLIVARSHCNDRIAASSAGSVNYRLSVQRNRARRKTASHGHFHMKWPQKRVFDRVVMVNRGATGNVKSSFFPSGATNSAARDLRSRRQMKRSTRLATVSVQYGWPHPQGHGRRCPPKSR